MIVMDMKELGNNFSTTEFMEKAKGEKGKILLENIAEVEKNGKRRVVTLVLESKSLEEPGPDSYSLTELITHRQQGLIREESVTDSGDKADKLSLLYLGDEYGSENMRLPKPIEIKVQEAGQAYGRANSYYITRIYWNDIRG